MVQIELITIYVSSFIPVNIQVRINYSYLLWNLNALGTDRQPKSIIPINIQVRIIKFLILIINSSTFFSLLFKNKHKLLKKFRVFFSLLIFFFRILFYHLLEDMHIGLLVRFPENIEQSCQIVSFTLNKQNLKIGR